MNVAPLTMSYCSLNINIKILNFFKFSIFFNLRIDEARLRDSISQLKTIRASVQSTLVQVETVHNDLASYTLGQGNKSRLRQLELEEAVMRQELMASREEKADLRAKVNIVSTFSLWLKMSD